MGRLDDAFGLVDQLEVQVVQIDALTSWQLDVMRVARKHFGDDAMRVDGPRFAAWLDESISAMRESQEAPHTPTTDK